MLQRAATNAYSWWWASHIRTKQSKWLEQNLQDMEEKVDNALKIIEGDGDSFAKRAEMYYRKRPELVAYVEESFRAYRALADRFDHLSRDLQSANRTMATVFPERVQYAMEDDDDETAPQTLTSLDDPSKASVDVPKRNIPKVPKVPGKDFRSKSMLISRKGTLKRVSSTSKASSTPRSGLTKEEALEEIDKLQKDILALQTEKEFVRIFYERGYERYWEFEDQINEMQKRVGNLQDEYGIGTVIEDDEARTLMAATALKSCKDSLVRLLERKDRSEEEARAERQRVKEAIKKFESLKYELWSKQADWCEPTEEHESESIDLESKSTDEERQEQDLLRAEIEKQLVASSNPSLTMTELAEKIDGLVNKVVSLETAVTSQNALVNRLKSETDELQSHIRSLEEEKETLMESSDHMRKRLKELEEELRRVNNLDRSVENENNNLQAHFTEASCNLDHLSSKLHTVKHDVEDEKRLFQKVGLIDAKPEKELKEHSDKPAPDDDSVDVKDKMTEVEVKKEDISILENAVMTGKPQEPMQQEQGERQDLSETVDSGHDVEPHEVEPEKDGQPNWRQLFLNGLEDREKVLLEEYTSILRDYKDMRKKLSDVEKKNRDNIFDLAMEIRELRNAVASKDKEIRLLKQKLNSPDANPDDSPYTCSTVYKYPHQDGQPESPNQAVASPYSTLPSPSVDKELFGDYLGEQTPGKFEDSSGNLKVTPRHEEEKIIRRKHTVRHHSVSAIEGRFRSDIDELLEENLEFWLRFSTSIHQIQKFQTAIQDLQSEFSKLKNNKKQEANSKQSDARAIYKHLREIHTELQLWTEHTAVLKDDLQSRFSSLCHIQEEISRLSNLGFEAEKMELISKYQAAKFQGEVLNMKQENNKVGVELQSGLNRVKALKVEVEKTLAQIDEELGISSSSNVQPKRSASKARIPLRSFLFGVKLRRQRPSIFSCVSPSLQKQYSDIAAAGPPSPAPSSQPPM